MPARGEDAQLSKYIAMLKWQGLWFFRGQASSSWRAWQLLRLVCTWVYPALIILSLSRFSAAEVVANPTLAMIGFSLITAISATIYFFKQHDLQDFVRGMQEVARRSPGEFERSTAGTWKYINFTLGGLWVFTLLFSGAPMVVDAVLAVLGVPDPLPAPMVWESFVPRTRSLWYYLLNLGHLALSASSVNTYSGVLASLPAFTSYVKFELAALEADLRAWAGDSRRRPEALHLIARRHAKLLKLVAVVKPIIGPCCGLLNFVGAISVSLLLHFAKKALLSGEYMVVVQNLYTIFFQVTLMYLSCLMGEKLRSQGLQVREALYESKWEEEIPATRRVLLQMGMAASKEIIVDFKNKLPLKLESFTELINTSYSMFMLMESLN